MPAPRCCAGTLSWSEDLATPARELGCAVLLQVRQELRQLSKEERRRQERAVEEVLKGAQVRGQAARLRAGLEGGPT